jgi:CubicO group peptidase (beta-lactamase class C family)
MKNIINKWILLLFCILNCLSFQNSNIWEEVDQILEDAIKQKAFPGCVAIALNKSGIIYSGIKGFFTYGIPPPMTPHINPKMDLKTKFDLASCTKVTATTSAIAQFYQRGEISLNTKIIDILGKDFGKNGKENITILNCLLHNAGLPPDPNPNYWSSSFGCPETDNYYPKENFSCQKKIYQSILEQKLENPIGEKYVYSDLSMITLMYVVGRLARNFDYIKKEDLISSCIENGDNKNEGTDQCYFEAYVRKYVFEKLNMKDTMFLPFYSTWKTCAPCENDTYYLHRVIQGQVSDGNAYALGGIAGHAGLFSTALDLSTLMYRLMFAEENDTFLNKTTVQYFIREYNHSQSSRALGWNTNDPTVFDSGWNLTCGDMSPTTFMHLGYTGTQLCGDPERQLITIFLTNRVYPTANNYLIESVRRKFNSAIVKIFDHIIKNSIFILK